MRIRNKLVLIILVCTTVPLCAALGWMAARDLRALANDTTDRNTVLADIVSEYSVPCLAFRDASECRQTLARLAKVRDVEAAILFDDTGRRFAGYEVAAEHLIVLPKEVPPLTASRMIEVPLHVDLFAPVEYGGVRYGTVLLRVSTLPMRARVREDLLNTLALAAASVLASFLLAVVLQRVITAPVLRLTQVVRKVSVDNDYAVRAIQTSHDEVGDLCDGVNAMLHTLERRNRDQNFLIDVGINLAESLDYDRTLRQIALCPTPTLADACVVAIADQKGTLDQVACVRRQSDDTPEFRTASRVTSEDLLNRIVENQAPHGTPPLRSSQETPLPSGANLWDEAMLCCHVQVPLVARGMTIGGLLLTRASQPYQPEDLPVVHEFAHRAALAIDNARLHRDTQHAVRARDEFLSVASHELRTPLTSLQLFVQGLGRMKEPERFAHVMRDSLDIVDQEVRRLDRLTSNLLDVARITQGRLGLERTETDLAALTREIARRFTQPAALAASTIVMDCASPVKGFWDPMRLDQVVTNLLSNAIKYGAQKPIRVTVQADSSTARLIVEDQGIGMDESDTVRVFERFERAVSSRHYGGLGLGLYISREIVQAHRGTIRVETQPGKGARFIVELPIDIAQIS